MRIPVVIKTIVINYSNKYTVIAIIQYKRMYLTLIYALIVSILKSAGAEWNTKDYMKREHSLIRPYQGL